jgi:hypothetical protein
MVDRHSELQAEYIAFAIKDANDSRRSTASASRILTVDPSETKQSMCVGLQPEKNAPFPRQDKLLMYPAKCRGIGAVARRLQRPQCEALER